MDNRPHTTGLLSRFFSKQGDSDWSKRFTADRNAAGISYGTLKTLRKTFISNLVNGAGVPIGIAMELAGHTQMKTTQLYLVGTDDQRKKAVRALEALG